jgi:hypothetical protein
MVTQLHSCCTRDTDASVRCPLAGRAARGSSSDTSFHATRRTWAERRSDPPCADRASQPLPSAPMTPPSRSEPRDPRVARSAQDQADSRLTGNAGLSLGVTRARWRRVQASDRDVRVLGRYWHSMPAFRTQSPRLRLPGSVYRSCRPLRPHHLMSGRGSPAPRASACMPRN